MRFHPFSLEPLSLTDVNARQLLDIAVQTGFDYVSFVLNGIEPYLATDPVVFDEKLRAELAARLGDTTVRMDNIEVFNLTPGARVTDFRAALECGHVLGARSATAVIWDNDEREDVLHKLAALCDMAAEYGIAINVEFFALSRSMSSLGAAVELVRDVQRPNAGVLVDLLHLMRTGGTVDDLRAVDPSLIRRAQVCDGPRVIDQDQAVVEAGGNRQLPGEGGLPVRAFLEAIPADIIVGIEVPQTSLIGRVPPAERAERMLDAARTVYRDAPGV